MSRPLRCESNPLSTSMPPVSYIIAPSGERVVTCVATSASDRFASDAGNTFYLILSPLESIVEPMAKQDHLFQVIDRVIASLQSPFHFTPFQPIPALLKITVRCLQFPHRLFCEFRIIQGFKSFDVGQFAKLVITHIFSLLRRRRGGRLAGGGTTGKPVIIAFAPRQGRGTEVRWKKFRCSEFRPAPLPGCDASALGFRWFHHRLISTALSGRKAGIAEREKCG